MNYTIPQVDPCFGRAEMRNVKKALRSKWVTEGSFSKKFISQIQEMTDAKYVVLAPNGTLAIYMCLYVIGVKKGDWVIVPDFTFNATASPLHFLGADPQFTDIELESMNIDPQDIENNIENGKTKAIMPVHIFGFSANMTRIMKIADRHCLPVIEDAAQGYGVRCEWHGNDWHVGTIGDLGLISFFTDKTVACGEGACILTNDEKLYTKLMMLRNQGRMSSGSFIHEQLGMNFRMTDLQCAVGVAQLERFPWIRYRKTDIWKQYEERLHPLVDVRIKKDDPLSVPFRYPLRIMNGKKQQVIEAMQKANIQVREFFYPLHKQPCWKYLHYEDHCFENTMQNYEEGICLPIYPTLHPHEVDYVCDTIIGALA